MIGRDQVMQERSVPGTDTIPTRQITSAPNPRYLEKTCAVSAVKQSFLQTA